MRWRGPTAPCSSSLAEPTDLDVSPDGLLVVGMRPGRPLRRFQLDGNSAIELEPVEALGYDGGAVSVAPNGRIAFTTAAGYGWTSGSAARFVPEGRVLTYRLDSGSYLTRWGRLFLDACQPPGTRLGVRFVTTDDDAVLDPTPPSPPARGSRLLPDPQATPPLAPVHLLAAAPDEAPLYRRPTGSERPWLPYQDGHDLQTYECPVSAPPGRYLWVELVLHGTGRSSPRVQALRVERPGHALLGALPRSWSRVEDDASFLFRLLAPAEGMLHDLDEWAAARAVVVNPQGAPSAALDWLASLAGLVLDQRWPQEAQRTLIAEAYSLFRRRGTRQALIRTLAIYLGYDPTLVEQWQLRGLAGAVLGTRPGSTLPPFIGGSAAQTGSLGRFAIGGSSPTENTYAAAAHRFKLVVRGNLTQEQRSVVQRILDLHRPAHTLVDICELGDGMRIGDGLRLDLTAYVGPGADWRPAVTGQIRIGADGVVGRRPGQPNRRDRRGGTGDGRMTQLFVERLTATAYPSDAARVRRLLSGVADHRLDQALAGASLASGDWCVRRVDVELRIDDRHTDGWIEERWAQALVSTLKQLIGSHADDVIHYRRPAQGLADLLAGLAAGRLEREWAWRQLGLLGPGDPGGGNPRAAACAAARRRPELALAALVEAVDRVGVIALHRMLGSDGWAELAAVVAAALGVPGLPVARATYPETGVDRAAERVADRVVSRSRLAARFRQARVRVDAQTAGAWAVLVAAEAEPAVIRGDRAGAVVSALAGDRVIPGPPEDGGPSVRRPTRAPGDAPSGTESPTEPAEPAREVLPRASSQATGSAEPVRPADRRRRHDDRPADTAPQPPADGEPRPAGHRPAAGDYSGVDGGRDDLDPHGLRSLDVPGADDADRRPTSWAGLFFLLATAADAGIPEALLADEALC